MLQMSEERPPTPPSPSLPPNGGANRYTKSERLVYPTYPELTCFIPLRLRGGMIII